MLLFRLSTLCVSRLLYMLPWWLNDDADAATSSSYGNEDEMVGARDRDDSVLATGASRRIICCRLIRRDSSSARRLTASRILTRCSRTEMPRSDFKSSSVTCASIDPSTPRSSNELAYRRSPRKEVIHSKTSLSLQSEIDFALLAWACSFGGGRAEARDGDGCDGGARGGIGAPDAALSAFGEAVGIVVTDTLDGASSSGGGDGGFMESVWRVAGARGGGGDALLAGRAVSSTARRRLFFAVAVVRDVLGLLLLAWMVAAVLRWCA